MIEETILLVTNSENISPSYGDNLDGMEIDIEHCFEESEVFNLVALKRKNDKGCMFQVELQVKDKINTLHDIRHSLQEAWDFIAYSYYGASSMETLRDVALLRFVTVIGSGQFYVTGKVVVSGEKYEALVANA